jgi:pyrophosphatase PpaX
MIKTVLFDLDGTIIDTNELIIQSFLHGLQGETPEPLTREHIIPHMGRPLIEQMEYFTGRQQVDEVITKYRAFNLAKHDELVKEFPHVHSVMKKLFDSGIQMGIVTSKIRKTTDMGLKLCKLDGFVKTVVTVEDVQNPKPDPEGILMAMRTLGSKPEETIMVGDSQYDIEAAQNAGVGSVGVSWSMKGRKHLEEFKPNHIIDDMRELLAIVGLAVDTVEKNR